MGFVTNFVEPKPFVYWTNSEVFGNAMKHCLECLVFYAINIYRTKTGRENGQQKMKNYANIINTSSVRQDNFCVAKNQNDKSQIVVFLHRKRLKS